MFKKLISATLLLLSTLLFSQENTNSTELLQNNATHNKGKFFVYWGWNRANYSKSDITLKAMIIISPCIT